MAETFGKHISEDRLTFEDILKNASKDELLLPYNRITLSKKKALESVEEDTRRLKNSYTEIYTMLRSYGPPESYKEKEGYALINDYLKKYKRFLELEEFLTKSLSILPKLYYDLPEHIKEIVDSKSLISKDLIRSVILKDPKIYDIAKYEIHTDREFALELMKKDPALFHHFSFFRYDKEMQLIAFLHDPNLLIKENIYKGNFNISVDEAKKALDKSPAAYGFLSPELKYNPEIMDIALSKDPMNLLHVDEDTQKNHKFIARILAYNGWSFGFFSKIDANSVPHFKDPKFIMEVYMRAPGAPDHISSSIYKNFNYSDFDPSFISNPQMLSRFNFLMEKYDYSSMFIDDPNAFSCFKPEEMHCVFPGEYFRNEKFAYSLLEYAKTNPAYLDAFAEGKRAQGYEAEIASVIANSLEYIPGLNNKLIGDPVIISELFKIAPQMVEYKDCIESEVFYRTFYNKDCAIDAVSLSGLNLQYVYEKYRDDEEIVLKAVEQNSEAIKHASERLQNDDKFLAELAIKNPEVLEVIPPEKVDKVKTLINDIEAKNSNDIKNAPNHEETIE